jgi:hypothetical protein
MYASQNFPTKTAFKKAVAEGKQITLFAPGLGTPVANGTESVSGPWSPKPHTWYANVEVKNGVVVKVR